MIACIIKEIERDRFFSLTTGFTSRDSFFRSVLCVLRMRVLISLTHLMTMNGVRAPFRLPRLHRVISNFANNFFFTRHCNDSNKVQAMLGYALMSSVEYLHILCRKVYEREFKTRKSLFWNQHPIQCFAVTYFVFDKSCPTSDYSAPRGSHSKTYAVFQDF